MDTTQIVLAGIAVLGGVVVPYLFHLYIKYRDKIEAAKDKQYEELREDRNRWRKAYYDLARDTKPKYTGDGDSDDPAEVTA